MLLTLGGEYRINRNYSVFFDSNNTNDNPVVNEVVGPLTPSWATLNSYNSNVRLVTIGIKGTF
jgi:hypothetical protein